MLTRGQIVMLCAIALLTLGMVMVNSAGMAVGPLEAPAPLMLDEAATQEAASIGSTPGATAPGETAPEAAPVGAARPAPRPVTAESILLSRSTAFMGLAIVAMGVASVLPVRRIAAALVPEDRPRAHGGGLVLYALGVVTLIGVLLTVYMPVIGKEVNEASRWIGLPSAKHDLVTLQPSELAKWGMIALIAWYAARRRMVMPRFFLGLLPGVIGVGAVAFVIVMEDLGTGVLVVAAAGLVLLAGGARVWHMLCFVPAGLLAVGAAIVTTPYRIMRLIAFLDPYADPRGVGYHMIQSMAAVAGGEGFGRGLGHGLQKFDYLPEDTTDFLFAIICEELGIAGAALVMTLLLGVLWAGLGVMRRETNPMLKLLALGVLATFGLQATMNLVVVTGLGPTKGIALPLVSSGGTGWVLTAFCLGLIVAMDRAQMRDVARRTSRETNAEGASDTPRAALAGGA